MTKGSHLIPLLMILGVAGVLWGCRQPEPVSEKVIRPVHYETIRATEGVRTRVFSGVAQPRLESQLSFRVSGTVEAINVRVGDRVSTDHLIARLDPVDYELQVEEANASLAQARAQARNAEAELRRVRELYENNNASKAEYDAVRAGTESARAQVEAGQKRLERARNQVSYTRLRAPRSGAIAEVQIEVNENVAAGRPIVLLTSETEPEVQVDIPDVVITQIHRGAPARVRFDALGDRSFPATVTEVGVATSRATTTFPVIVRLQGTYSEVLAGMAAEVEFRFGSEERRARILVSPEAVGEDRQGRFVYRIEGGAENVGVVRRQPVEVGRLTPEGLEILQGLHEGDRIVTAGMSRIEDGHEVKLARHIGG